MQFDPSIGQDLTAVTERMRRLAMALLGNAHDAEDATQEAWTRALQGGTTPEDCEAWLSGVARNVAREHRRAAMRRRHRETGSAKPESQSPHQLALDHIEAVHSLVQVVRSMPQPYRSALVLQYVVGMAPTEAAEALGVKRATLRSQVHRGLEMVRAELERRSQGDCKRWQAALVSLVASAARVTLGGILVTKATSWAGVALLLLLIGAGWHLAHSERDDPLEEATEPTSDSADMEPGLSAPAHLEVRQTPPAPAEGMSLRVVDMDGEPVREATVHSVPPQAHHVAREGRWTGSTDEHGRLALPVETPRTGEVLLVRHPGYVPQVVEIGAEEEQEDREIEVVLQRGLRVAGFVEDPWGGRIAGAKVVVRRQGAAAPMAAVEALPGPDTAKRYWVTTSDGDGRFAFTGIAALPVSVAAHKPFSVCFNRPEHNAKEARDDVRLVLYPQARVGIRAVDASTRLPIPQFRAEAAQEAHGQGYRRSALELPREDLPATGLSRSGGEYWLTFSLTKSAAPSPGKTVPILVEAWGYQRTTVEVPVRYPGDEDFAIAQDVFLEPLAARDQTGHVAFNISFPALGRGPGQAWISLKSTRLDIPTMTDKPRGARIKARSSLLLWLKDGRSSVELPTGSYEVMLGGGSPVPYPSDWTSFSVRKDESTTVNLTIPGSIVRVRAYGPEGESIPYFAVSANWKGGAMYKSHALLQRGEEMEEEMRAYGTKAGEIVLALAPKKQVLFTVIVPGYEVWHEMRDVEPETTFKIDAQLKRLKPEAK